MHRDSVQNAQYAAFDSRRAFVGDRSAVRFAVFFDRAEGKNAGIALCVFVLRQRARPGHVRVKRQFTSVFDVPVIVRAGRDRRAVVEKLDRSVNVTVGGSVGTQCRLVGAVISVSDRGSEFEIAVNRGVVQVKLALIVDPERRVLAEIDGPAVQHDAVCVAGGRFQEDRSGEFAEIRADRVGRSTEVRVSYGPFSREFSAERAAVGFGERGILCDVDRSGVRECARDDEFPVIYEDRTFVGECAGVSVGIHAAVIQLRAGFHRDRPGPERSGRAVILRAVDGADVSELDRSAVDHGVFPRVRSCQEEPAVTGAVVKRQRVRSRNVAGDRAPRDRVARAGRDERIGGEFHVSRNVRDRHVRRSVQQSLLFRRKETVESDRAAVFRVSGAGDLDLAFNVAANVVGAVGVEHQRRAGVDLQRRFLTENCRIRFHRASLLDLKETFKRTEIVISELEVVAVFRVREVNVSGSRQLDRPQTASGVGSHLDLAGLRVDRAAEIFERAGEDGRPSPFVRDDAALRRDLVRNGEFRGLVDRELTGISSYVPNHGRTAEGDLSASERSVSRKLDVEMVDVRRSVPAVRAGQDDRGVCVRV